MRPIRNGSTETSMYIPRKHRFRNDIAASSITPETVYRGRRELLRLLGLGVVALSTGCHSEPAPAPPAPAAATDPADGKALEVAKHSDTTGGEAQTTYKDATHYNNF